MSKKPSAQILPPRRPLQQTLKSNSKATVPVRVAQTPKVSTKKKACSTPALPDTTIADLTLDASSIPELDRTRVPKNNSLDDTMVAPRMSSAFMTGKADKAVPRTGARSASGSSTDSGGAASGKDSKITDEMIEIAYIRYIQAEYIAKKTREAKETGNKEIQDQLYTVWNATEKLRQETAKIELERNYWDTLALVGRSLKLVKEKISPALELMLSVDGNLKRVGEGLDLVQHHLEVKGVTLTDQESAEEELEALCSLIKEFNRDFEARRIELGSRASDMKKLADAYEKVASDYKARLNLLRDCMKKAEQCNKLTIQETSLLMSFHDLREAEEKAAKEAARQAEV